MNYKWKERANKVKNKKPITYIKGLPIYESNWIDVGTSFNLKGKKYFTSIGFEIVSIAIEIMPTANPSIYRGGIREKIRQERKSALIKLESKIENILKENKSNPRTNRFIDTKITYEDIFADAPDEILIS